MRNILRINVPEPFSLGARTEAFRECRCQGADEWATECFEAAVDRKIRHKSATAITHTQISGSSERTSSQLA